MDVSIPTMPEPADDELKTLADRIGYPLPASYLDFVKLHDGAEPEANSIITSDNEIGVSRFIPVREASDLGAGIDGFPADAIPLAEDDCGNYFYVAPRTGHVYFWDHELEGADEQLAEGAMAFAEKLKPFDVSTVKLTPGQVKSAWIDPSFKPEF
jgi:hypothetical protein